MPYVRVNEIPNVGQPLQSVRNKLEQLNIREVEVFFTDKISNLGASWHDHYRTDVYLFQNDQVSGWQGQYGGSYAAMYSKATPAQATAGLLNTDLPNNCAALEVVNGYNFRRAKLHLNPSFQAGLLPAHEEVSERLLKILAHFKSLKAVARPEYLLRSKVTQDELDELVNRKWIKPHNGKHPTVNGRNIDLAGCQITTEGKNAVGNVRVW